ncbi:orfX3 [Salmonella enterica]|nr:orfX3 [Salmonella enterica]
MPARDYDQLSSDELTRRLRQVRGIRQRAALSFKHGSPRSQAAATLSFVGALYVYGTMNHLLALPVTGVAVYLAVSRYSRLPATWQAHLAQLLSRLEPVWSSPLRELNTGSASWSFAEYCLQQEMDLILIALRHPVDRLNA